jgi:hypothetical protein
VALNRATRVTLAQTLYHQREMGHSEERAVAYVTARFPGVTQADLRWARDQLARAETATYRLGLWTQQATVGRREGAGYELGTEGETDPHRRLREALAGERAPAHNVGVRVELITTRPDGSLQPVSVYLNMTWDSTVQDVIDAAAQAAADLRAAGSDVVYHGFRYSGPTRWPAPAQY